jgi:hypothetical protein
MMPSPLDATVPLTLKEEARRLAVETSETPSGTEIRRIESALLAFAKLVLEREPSGEEFEKWWAKEKLIPPWSPNGIAKSAYLAGGRAMTNQLLKELTE